MTAVMGSAMMVGRRPRSVVVVMTGMIPPAPTPAHTDINGHIGLAGFISSDIPFVHNCETELLCFHKAANRHFGQNIRIATCISGDA